MTNMLGYTTWRDMPRLKDYKDALDRYENTKPIRGCPNALRPAGRRDQKWFNIAKGEDGRVVIGYHWLNLESDQTNAIITYMPTGEILIGPHSLSASTRERILKITGIRIDRAQYHYWALATHYVDGKAVRGWFAMPKDEPAIFVSRVLPIPPTATKSPIPEREHIMLNAQPVYKHTLRKGVVASIMSKMDGFLRYVEALTRLTTDRPDWELGMQQVPRMEWMEMRKLNMPNGVLSAHYWDQDKATANRAKLFEMIEQGEADPEQWQNAMYWMSSIHYSMPYRIFVLMLRDYVMAHHRDEIFEKSRCTYGVVSRDRYAKYFRR
jgi:hypothetical protein